MTTRLSDIDVRSWRPKRPDPSPRCPTCNAVLSSHACGGGLCFECGRLIDAADCQPLEV